MPRQCILCNSQYRQQIDRYLSTGATHPEFRKQFAKYSFSKISKWQFSRHKRHIEEDTVTRVGKKDELSAETAETVTLLHRINRKLLAFAQRSERSGKSAQHAISAYSTIIRTVEMMEKLKTPEQKPEEPKTLAEYEVAAEKLWEGFKKHAKPEELGQALDEKLKALVKQPGIGTWFAESLERAYPQIVENDTQRIVESLLRDSETRAQLRERILASDEEKLVEAMTANTVRCERLRLALIEKDVVVEEADDELVRLRSAMREQVPTVPDAPGVEHGADIRPLLADADRRAEVISILTNDYWAQWCETTAAKNQLLRDYGQPYACFWYPPREIPRPA